MVVRRSALLPEARHASPSHDIDTTKHRYPLALPRPSCAVSPLRSLAYAQLLALAYRPLQLPSPLYACTRATNRALLAIDGRTSGNIYVFEHWLFRVVSTTTIFLSFLVSLLFPAAVCPVGRSVNPSSYKLSRQPLSPLETSVV